MSSDVPKLAIAVAVVGGYILGRTKKGRMAFAATTYLAGRRFGLEPQQLLAEGARRLRELPQFEELSGQLRGETLKAGRQAMGAVADRKLSELADSLHARTERMGKSQEAETEEEAEPEDEYEGEAEEQPEDGDEEDTSEGEPESEAEEPKKPEPRHRRTARKQDAGRDRGARGPGAARRPTEAGPRKASSGKPAVKKAPAKKTAARTAPTRRT
ncbi:histone protein [Streptomyces sp. ME19-03-3]|nr:histone protein [Streptomyces sp. ME19-03-3]